MSDLYGARNLVHKNGIHVIEGGAPWAIKTEKTGRLCSIRGCKTKLSIYNSNSTCYLHSKHYMIGYDI